MFNIILAGISGSGKTSIKSVTFDKRYPQDTIYNPITYKLESYPIETLGICNLNLIEFPGTFSYESITEEYIQYITKSKVIIFVYDIQGDKDKQFEYFKKNILPIFSKYKGLSLYIFLHKVDSNISKYEVSKQGDEFKTKIEPYKKNQNIENSNIFQTSIYNSTMFEAFSNILQDLLPTNRNMSTLLQNLSQNCGFEKAYLIDLFNKIYLAFGDKAIDSDNFNMCSEFIELILGMVGLYSEDKKSNEKIFDDNTDCSVKIGNNDLIVKFIDKNLALVAFGDRKNIERKNIIDYNINLFREGVNSILQVHK